MGSAYNRGRWIGSFAVVGLVLAIGVGLMAWKSDSIRAAEAASANQPEPVSAVTVAVAKEQAHRETTTSIGTVLALRSITLRNEVAGVVRESRLVPGQVVEAGTVLVALDVSVEEAELEAQEAHAALARTAFDRLYGLKADGAASQEEVDQARAELDVAVAQIARIRAIIGRKTIRAPFRAVVGISDVHPGQYLDAGTQLTTLQGVAESVHVDFSVAQQVAAGLAVGQRVSVVADGGAVVAATVVAIDAAVDPVTRSAMVRARTVDASGARPGASVRVIVPLGQSDMVVTVPATALRKGPAGDHVFVLVEDASGATRAQVRPVRSGSLVGDEIVITEGLEPGERVAALGSFKLYESALVAMPEAATDAGSSRGGAR